jgi:hypothetical protein
MSPTKQYTLTNSIKIANIQQEKKLQLQKIPMDVATCRNSIFKMLSSVLNIFDHIGAEETKMFGFDDADADTDVFCKLCNVLGYFTAFSKMLCSETVVIIIKLLPIYNSLFDLLEETSALIFDNTFHDVE